MTDESNKYRRGSTPWHNFMSLAQRTRRGPEEDLMSRLVLNLGKRAMGSFSNFYNTRVFRSSDKRSEGLMGFHGPRIRGVRFRVCN